MFKSVDKFTKIFIITAVLIAIATPFIVKQYQNFQQEAAGKNLSATIAIETRTTDSVTFKVTRSVPYDKDTIWVTNHCFDASGNRISKQDNVVLWGTTVSLIGTTQPFPTTGAKCTAFVTLRPWQDRPLGDAIISYSGNVLDDKGGTIIDAGGSTIILNPASDLRLGGIVTFTSNPVGLDGWEYPMIAVWCYQNTNLVYMQLAHPNDQFVLGGGSSDWKTNGGSAYCEAYLYAYGSKGQQESIRTLAGPVKFNASP